MQSTLETVDQLTRRLNVAVPLATIEGEVSKRLARLAKFRQGAGLPPGPRADEDGRAAVRSAGALRRHLRRGAVELQRRRARAEPARGGLSANRAGRRRDERRRARVLGGVRVYPEVQLGDIGSLAIERPVVEVTAADIDRTLEVLRRQRATFAPRDADARRATGPRSTSPAPSTASSSRAARPRTSRSRWARATCCPSSTLPRSA